MKTEKCCGNCKNFKRHYVIINAEFSPIDWGHCMENCRYKKFYETDSDGCEKWELCNSVIEQYNFEYYITGALRKINKIAEALEALSKQS